MAPRRGGGSSSSGGISVGSCPHAFKSDYLGYSTPIPYFVSYVLFMVLFTILLVGTPRVTKRHGNAKKLLGFLYYPSLLFIIFYYLFQMIATLLRECETTPYYSYYIWVIVWLIFLRLSNYLLLVIVVWDVNRRLCERLGSGKSLIKIVTLSIVGVMGALTAGMIGLQSYNYSLLTPSGMSRFSRSYKFDEQVRLSMAYWVLYLVSVLAGGALAIKSLLSMRSRRIPVGDLLGWVVGLTFCMFFWTLLIMTLVAMSLSENYVEDNVQYAFEYLMDFFTLFSYIALVFLAKSSVWNNHPIDDGLEPHMYQQPSQYDYHASVPPQLQQQNGYGQPGQQYYYQQQSVHDAPELVNGHQGHIGQPK